MPHERDEEFARRLGERDARVLYDIDAALSGALRGRLNRHRSRSLRDADIDEIVQDALTITWRDFRPSDGKSVQAFYFGVANNLRLTVMRGNRRRLKREGNDETQLATASGWIDEPRQRLIDVETATEKSLLTPRISALVEQAVAKLTPRQRLAFERRRPAISRASYDWAAELENETGTAAQRWRKASDEAVKSIKAHLSVSGVRFSREEDRFEIA